MPFCLFLPNYKSAGDDAEKIGDIRITTSCTVTNSVVHVLELA